MARRGGDEPESLVARARAQERPDAAAPPGRGILRVRVRGPCLRGAGAAPLAPCADPGVDIPCRRHHRRTAEQLPPRLDHPPVEVLERLAHVVLVVQLVELRVELAVLDAQRQRGRAETGELLGLDPLYVANEGKLLAIVPELVAESLVATMRQHPMGQQATIIGQVVEEHPGMVIAHTGIGGKRVVDMQVGEQLPRIC